MGNFSRLLVTVFLLSSVGCGVGLEDSGSDTARDEKNQKLRSDYEAIKGTYEGDVKILGLEASFPIKLYLFWNEVQEEPLPGDLKPGLRVVLRGRFMQSDYIGDSDNLILKGQFDPINGTVFLEGDAEASKTSTGCRLGGQDPIKIVATLSGNKITGIVSRNEQPWARFGDVKRTTRDVSGGSTLSEEQEYRRLQEMFEPVTGTYEGRLSRQLCTKGQPTHEEVKLLMYVERRQEGVGLNGSPCYVPRLMARTFRSLEGELADVTYRSVSRFDPKNFLPQFQSTNVINGGTADGTGARASVLEMAFDKSKTALKGSILTTGQWGEIEVGRVNKAVVAPNDETLLMRERRLLTYSKYIADYKGEVIPFDKAVKKWAAYVRLYADEAIVEGRRLPVLLAYYTRSGESSDPTIGSRLMMVDVRTDECQPMLIMHSDANGGPGPIPGIGRMHFAAPYVNGVLSGDLVDHRGPQGVMTIKRPGAN